MSLIQELQGRGKKGKRGQSPFCNLELTEQGDRWFSRVKALAPGSATAQVVGLKRTLARREFEQALILAELMVTNQVDLRRGAFATALFAYTDLMMRANRSKEAWDFLTSVKPEITNYDVLPVDVKATFMQFTSILLMTDFEYFETRKEAWSKLAGNLDAVGFPWRDPKDSNFGIDLIMLGETEAAAENYLNDRLSKPMATNVDRHKPRFESLNREVYNDPRVVTRVAEMDREYDQLREEIGELMLEPEWNQ